MILMVLKVHVLRGEFDKVRKKNEESEDKLQTQIKELQLQLDDMRLEHRLVSSQQVQLLLYFINRSHEGSLEKDITSRKDTIDDLKQTIVRRQTELGLLEENERKISSVTLTSATTLTKLPSYERRSSIILPTAPAHNPFYPSLDLDNVHVPHVSDSHVTSHQPAQLGAIARTPIPYIQAAPNTTPIPFVQAAPRTRKKHMQEENNINENLFKFYASGTSTGFP